MSRWLAGAILVLVAGCSAQPAPVKVAATSPSTPAGTPAPSPRPAVAWVPFPPGQVVPQPDPVQNAPVPAGTRPCAAGQLEAAALPSAEVAHSSQTAVVFRDRGSSACSLAGFPTLTIYTPGGAVAISGTPRAYPEYSYPATPVLLRPGVAPIDPAQAPYLAAPGQAAAYVDWYDCAHVAARIAIDLPQAGGRLSIDFAVNPYNSTCGGPGAHPAALAGSPFIATGMSYAARHVKVAYAIDAPPYVVKGSTIVYYVTVTNEDSVDYVLTPCPDYEESFQPLGQAVRLRLNCAPGKIAAGASTTFEMRLGMPADSFGGVLTWQLLDDRLSVAAPAQAPVSVTV